MEFFAAHVEYAWFFLIMIAVFPRLTMLFAVLVPFTPVMWFGWIILPEVLVAVLAYQMYWLTNPDLVIAAAAWAFYRTVQRGTYAGHLAKYNASTSS